MINVMDSTQEAERQEEEAHYQFRSSAKKIRAGFEDFMRVNFEETGFLSNREVQDQRQYMENLLSSERNNWDPLISSYLSDFAEQSKSMNRQMYRNEVEGPLKNALSDGIISAQSFSEWIAWIRDPERSASTKKASISSALPTYLSERRSLATKRESILNDARFKKLSDSNDPTIKALCAKLSDSSYFLNSLSFEQRTSLITDVLATLPIVDSEQKLFEKFSAELSAATGKYISAASQKRWIARFNDPSVNPKAREYFVTQQFPSYVQSWKNVHEQYDKLRAHPMSKALNSTDVKSISAFHTPSTFLDLHYDKKKNLVQEVQNAITAKENGIETLHAEIKAVIDTAVQAGYVSSNNSGYLVAHMIERERSVQEVKNFAKEWAKIRHRFDQVEGKMTDGKVPQGFVRLSEAVFLSLTYAQRKSYVEEAESRIGVEAAPVENTAFQDIKGKVRHALDTENWSEASMFLAQAWPLATSEEQRSELQSMERYLQTFNSGKGSEDNEQQQSAEELRQEINTCLSQLPVPLRPFFERALPLGAGCVRTVRVMCYNVQWSLDRGYLPRDLSSVRDTAREETKLTMRPGIGHSNRVENNLVDGYEKPAINDEPTKAQNICTSSSEAGLIAQTANNNKDNFNFWYWSNLIVSGVSAGEYENVANNLSGRITRAAYKLEAMGFQYSSVGTMASRN